MLNREEYNATFHTDLSQEDFEKLATVVLGKDDIRNTESFSFVDPVTHEVTEFVQVVRCRNCRYWQDNNGGYPHDDCKWDKDETPDADDFCSGGKRKEDVNGTDMQK